MPDTLKTAVEGIFLSIYAAVEQAIDESMQSPSPSRPRKTAKSPAVTEK